MHTKKMIQLLLSLVVIGSGGGCFADIPVRVLGDIPDDVESRIQNASIAWDTPMYVVGEDAVDAPITIIYAEGHQLCGLALQHSRVGASSCRRVAVVDPDCRRETTAHEIGHLLLVDHSSRGVMMTDAWVDRDTHPADWTSAKEKRTARMAAQYLYDVCLPH